MFLEISLKFLSDMFSISYLVSFFGVFSSEAEQGLGFGPWPVQVNGVATAGDNVHSLTVGESVCQHFGTRHMDNLQMNEFLFHSQHIWYKDYSLKFNLKSNHIFTMKNITCNCGCFFYKHMNKNTYDGIFLPSLVR